jgi:pSer/pThr/pTyr-binding forkhead associated (FHA) protein
LAEDSTLALGHLAIRSGSNSAAVTWVAVLDVAGRRLNVPKGQTSVGRDASAGLQINDSSLSRTHFEIIWDGSLAGLRDLGSTNGTRLEGQPVVANKVVALANDSKIVAGRSQFVFRIIAKSESDA